MKDFYVSYHISDEDYAKWLAGQLEAAGYSTHLAAWDFRAGSNLIVEVQGALTGKAQRVIALLSPDYLLGEMSQAELAAMLGQDPAGQRGRLLPAMIKPCTPTGLLAQLRTIHLENLDEASARQRLLESLDHGGPSRRAPFPAVRARGEHACFPRDPQWLLQRLPMPLAHGTAHSEWTAVAALTDAARAEGLDEGQGGDGSPPNTLRAFFELVLAYRSRILYAAPRGADFCTRMADRWLGALVEVLGTPALFGGLRLAHAQVRSEAAGFAWAWQDLTGPVNVPLVDSALPAREDVQPGAVYFTGPGALVPLAPLVAYCEDDIGRGALGFVHPGRRRVPAPPVAGGQATYVVRADYLDYATGQNLKGLDATEALTGLLRRLRGRPATTQDLEQVQERSAAASSSLPEDIVSADAALGDFELLGELGRGGMGIVYRARQRSLRRIDTGSKGSTEQSSALQESADRPLALRLAELFADAAIGLAYLHQQNLIHRDIKPGNLMLTRDGRRIVLADLGLARLLDASQALSQSQMPQVGTLRYMAPELLGGQPADARSDVYALGATLYELLAGRPMRDGETETHLRQQILTEQPPSLRRLGRFIPSDLATVIEVATAQEPSRRYPTAQALAADLRAVVEHRPIAARPPGLLHRVQLSVHRRPEVAALMATLLLLPLLLGIAYWQWARESCAYFTTYVERHGIWEGIGRVYFWKQRHANSTLRFIRQKGRLVRPAQGGPCPKAEPLRRTRQ